MTCTHVIQAIPGTLSHPCGEPAIGYVLDPWTHERIVLCEECAKGYRELGYTVLLMRGKV
jgi:hypothetical protein